MCATTSTGESTRTKITQWSNWNWVYMACKLIGKKQSPFKCMRGGFQWVEQDFRCHAKARLRMGFLLFLSFQRASRGAGGLCIMPLLSEACNNAPLKATRESDNRGATDEQSYTSFQNQGSFKDTWGEMEVVGDMWRASISCVKWGGRNNKLQSERILHPSLVRPIACSCS